MSQPRVVKGTGVYVRKGETILFGLRNANRGPGRDPGTWCLPGGHVEEGESFEQCACREVTEEASIKISDLRELGVIEDFIVERNTVYVTTSFVADWVEGEPVPLPEEFDEWRWVQWEHLPQPLFRPTMLCVEQFGNPLEI